MSTPNQNEAPATDRIVVTWHLEDFAGLMVQLSAPVDAPVRAAWS
jgi:hypothetical protein